MTADGISWCSWITSLNCKNLTHVHNYEHEQIPMVTDLRKRPVMGFLYLGVEAGGVYIWTFGQRLDTPILQQGELPSCPGERIYAAAQVDLPLASKTARLDD